MIKKDEVNIVSSRQLLMFPNVLVTLTGWKMWKSRGQKMRVLLSHAYSFMQYKDIRTKHGRNMHKGLPKRFREFENKITPGRRLTSSFYWKVFLSHPV